MSETTAEERLEAAVSLLRENGYQVSRKTACTTVGGHGRHTLKTRSEVCPGEEPMPHGYRSGHQGTFDWWVHCQCGSAFPDNDGPRGWAAHTAEHGIAS
jgi:hypothetical protein